jgi:ribosomal protein S27AE
MVFFILETEMIDEKLNDLYKEHSRKPTSTGWICPLCGRVLAPHIVECVCDKNGWKEWAPERPRRYGIHWYDWTITC